MLHHESRYTTDYMTQIRYKYVGIMGAAGAGKDTAANAIIEMTPGWTKLSWAEPLKRVTAKVFNIPLEALHSLEEKEKPRDPIIIDNLLSTLEWEINLLVHPEICTSNFVSLHIQPQGLVAHSYRQLLQYIGTDYVRSASNTFWVDYVTKHQIPKCQHVVIPDTRFENEIKAIHDLGGLVINVEREDVSFANDHPSARDLRHLADHTILFPVGGFHHIKRWASMFVCESTSWKMYESKNIRVFLNAYQNGAPLDVCSDILGVIQTPSLIHQMAQDYGITPRKDLM